MMRKIVLVMIGIVLLAVAGCGNNSGSAAGVAENFWTAMKDHDLDTALQYATVESAEFLSLNENPSEETGEVTLGEAVIEGDKATIPTTIIADNDDGSSMEVPMQTVLVKQSGEWRVDAQATMFSVFGGAMGAMMEEMTRAMAEGMKAGMEGMMDSMSEGLQEGTQEQN